MVEEQTQLYECRLSSQLQMVRHAVRPEQESLPPRHVYAFRTAELGFHGADRGGEGGSHDAGR